jgi:hypothetical protein
MDNRIYLDRLLGGQPNFFRQKVPNYIDFEPYTTSFEYESQFLEGEYIQAQKGCKDFIQLYQMSRGENGQTDVGFSLIAEFKGYHAVLGYLTRSLYRLEIRLHVAPGFFNQISNELMESFDKKWQLRKENGLWSIIHVRTGKIIGKVLKMDSSYEFIKSFTTNY